MFGKKVKLFVADAKYRGESVWYYTPAGTYDGFDVPGISNISIGEIRFQLPATEISEAPMGDEELQTLMAPSKTTQTAEEATTQLSGYSYGNAGIYCRNQKIPGVGALDLPNLYELAVMYLESDNIDALDPTASLNANKLLGAKNPNGRFHIANSGGIFSVSEVSADNTSGVVNGIARQMAKRYAAGVAPVKELSIS